MNAIISGLKAIFISRFSYFEYLFCIEHPILMFWANLHKTQNISKYQLIQTINRPFKCHSYIVSIFYFIQNVVLLLAFQSAYYKGMSEEKTDNSMECVWG